MTLAEGQVQLRELLIGPGTPIRFRGRSHFNPFVRFNRSDQGDKRAWRNGSWSGLELKDEAVIPMRLVTLGVGAAGMVALQQQIAAAFAPASEDLELRFTIGGVEYVMFGRPRMVEPEPRFISGECYYQCAFVALDPGIYSGAEHSVQLVLPVVTGGLTFPITFPVTFSAVSTSNTVGVTNAGTEEAGLRLRIDGPVVEPRVSTLLDGVASTLNLALTLTSGQWVDIDTRARTVYLNGTVSRRGQAWGAWPMLAPGITDIQFNAGSYDAAAQLTVSWRDCWH